MPGEFSARILKERRKKFRWKKEKFRRRILGLRKKDVSEGAPQMRGIVLEKRVIEQKQPHSGLIKAVRVKILKNGKEVTAVVPKTGAINYISEHDEVLLEGLGGSQGGAVGSIWGARWKVVAVNGIPLELLRTGKRQKPTK
ncbi:MAG: 30S ribosomal protein S12 [Candidatus Aenigmatarchaeota archaeon]